ncbi:MAG: DUF4160 domain-containing protein [Bauldia sp.]|nr:MAG: DUF4160 domain-containing protein [Bauldia sp.]
MPTVAVIDGITVQFYWEEHPPPHFHVEFAEHQAVIDIDSLEIIEGYLPKPQYRKIVAWAKSRRTELLEAWTTCRSDLNPGQIR